MSNSNIKYEFKGTPGPWRILTNSDSPKKEGFYNEVYNGIKAGTCGFGPSNRNEGFEISGCISIENAHLIAASPILLSAIIKAIELRDLWGAPTDPSNIHECYIGEMQALQQMEDTFRAALDAADVTITEDTKTAKP